MKSPSHLPSARQNMLLFVVTFASAWVHVKCFHINPNMHGHSNNAMHLSPQFSLFQMRPILSMNMETGEPCGNKSTVDSNKSALLKNVDSSAVNEAKKLREKAQKLMIEANTAEVALRASKQEADSIKNLKLDQIFDDLQIILAPNAAGSEEPSTEVEISRRLANVLREKRLSSTTVEDLVVRQYKLLVNAEKRIRDASINIDSGFNIGDTSNAIEFKEAEFRSREIFIERIIDAQSLLDKDANTNSGRGLAPVLEARIRSLKRAGEVEFQRNLAFKVNGVQGQLNFDGTLVNSFSKDTLGEQNITIKVDGREISGPKANMTRIMEDIMHVPQWVPSSILPFLIVCQKEIDADDFKKIRSNVLCGSCFNVENCDYTRTAAIYRGFFNDRQQATIYGTNSISASNQQAGEDRNIPQKKSSQLIFQEIQDRLKQAGLADKIQLFLIEDPEWRPGDLDPEPLPSILAISIDVIPEQGIERGKTKTLLSVLAVVSSLFATFAYAVSSFALNPSFFDAIVNKNEISNLGACLPIFLGVLGISAVHELAHRVAANKSDVKIGLPVPLPSLQIGTFGSITALRSFPKSRTAMFDVAMSGPIAGAVISILLMIIGISFSTQASPESLSTFAVAPAAIMKTSFLVGSVASIMAPKVMTIPASQLIPIHPLFFVGFSGLVSSALNLLPIGRLDGGRACTAIFGRRSSYLVSFATLLFLAIGALTQTSAISIFWGLLVTLFQRNADIPMRDELSEVDDARAGVYISCIVLTVLTLTPFPGGPVL